MPVVAIGVDRWRRHQEVSILIAAGGVGRYFGSQPHAKVSMMIMRLPQYGNGRGSAGLFERSFGRLGLFWAARRQGEQPMDAMEALRQHVDQEAPDGLVSRQRHHLVAGGPSIR